MARKSTRLREKSKTRLNRKPKTRPAKKKLAKRLSDRRQKAKAPVSRREGIRRNVSQVVNARTSTGKRLTVIRGPKSVDSSWVDEIAYVRYGTRNGVAVKFLSGAEVFYPFTSIRDYEYLRDAASKGKAIHRRFYELPYEMLN